MYRYMYIYIDNYIYIYGTDFWLQQHFATVPPRSQVWQSFFDSIMEGQFYLNENVESLLDGSLFKRETGWDQAVVYYPVVRRERFGAMGIHIPIEIRRDSELLKVSQPSDNLRTFAV